MKMLVKMLLMLLLVATTAQAQQSGYYPPKIDALMGCTVAASLMPVPGAVRDRYFREASQCLEDTVEGALDEAKDTPDLRAAVKNFYLKSVRLVANRDSRSAQTDENEAAMAVKLETKLAGLANEAALKKQQ